MDYLAISALVVALMLVIWLFASMSTQNFNAAIMPVYPSAASQEQMNTAITRSYPMYPRVAAGSTFTAY